jgi:hypothetical protein
MTDISREACNKATLEAEVLRDFLLKPGYQLTSGEIITDLVKKARALRDALDAAKESERLAVSRLSGRCKTITSLRAALVNIVDGLVDEDDRVYFGSTNDADELRDLHIQLDQWNWAVIASDVVPDDPYASARNAWTKAGVLQAGLNASQAKCERMREALKPFSNISPSFDRWMIPGPSGFYEEREKRQDHEAILVRNWPVAGGDGNEENIYTIRVMDFRRARAALEEK